MDRGRASVVGQKRRLAHGDNARQVKLKQALVRSFASAIKPDSLPPRQDGGPGQRQRGGGK